MAIRTVKLECLPLGEWDATQWQPTLQLFHADRSLQDAQIELIIRRSQGEMELGVKMVTEHLELALKKRHLKRAFVRANKVIKENRAGTLRTAEKIKESVKEILILADQISRARREIGKQHQTKGEMEVYVQQYSRKYEKFLERVATASPEFHSVRDILDRFENLEICRRECEQLVEEEMSEASKMRQEMSQLMMEQSTRLKKLNNSLEMITVRYKEARDTRVMWEDTVKYLQGYWSDMHCESEVMHNGCHDLYTKICQGRGAIPTVAHRNTQAQLHYIQTTISFFKEALRLATAINQERENNKLVKMSPSLVKSLLDVKKRRESQKNKSIHSVP